MANNAKPENPFTLSGYRGPDYFADRQEETSLIFDSLKGGDNILLYGRPRMGKTTLIAHVLDFLKRKNQYFKHLYVDTFQIQSLEDLIQALITDLLARSGSDHRKWSSGLMGLLRSIGASITFDPISDMPKVQIELKNFNDVRTAFHALLDYLEEDRKPWILILDEIHLAFQFDKGTIGELLVEMMSQHSRVRFIVIANDQEETHNLLKTAVRESISDMQLGSIDIVSFTRFIKKHFDGASKQIDDESLQFIYTAMRGQTYGIQLLCNRLYNDYDHINIDAVSKTLDRILREERPVFGQIHQLITATQWKLLQAIANEDLVQQPMASDFIKKYDLKSPSTVQTALKALVQKSLVYRGEAYELQDILMARWLKKIGPS